MLFLHLFDFIATQVLFITNVSPSSTTLDFGAFSIAPNDNMYLWLPLFIVFIFGAAMGMLLFLGCRHDNNRRNQTDQSGNAVWCFGWLVICEHCPLKIDWHLCLLSCYHVVQSAVHRRMWITNDKRIARELRKFPLFIYNHFLTWRIPLWFSVICA